MTKQRVVRHEVVQPLDESYRLIPLTQGQNAIVDAADFEWLSQWNWCAHWSSRTKSFYAKRGKPQVSMQAVIMNCVLGDLVDHGNHDTLDNRRQNLRKVTWVQSNQNRRRQCKGCSGFKGVSKSPSKTIGDRWRAMIQVNGKAIHLGMFASPEEAARAYDEAAKKHHSKFAWLNFPS
jgi:AP2 domain